MIGIVGLGRRGIDHLEGRLRELPPEPKHPRNHERAAENTQFDESADQEIVRVLGLFDRLWQSKGEI